MKHKILVLTLLAAVLLCGCTQKTKLSASEYNGLLVYTTVAYSDYFEDYKAYVYKGGKLIESNDYSGLKQCLDITSADGGFPEIDNPGINKLIAHIAGYEKDGKYYASHIYIAGGKYFFSLIKGDYSATELYAYDVENDASVKLFDVPELEIISYVGYHTDTPADGYVSELCFFDSSVSESDKNAVSYSVAELSDEDYAKLYTVFSSKSYSDDSICDRVAFSFDGKFSVKKDGSFRDVFFGYADKVIYYDHYFAELSDEELAFIKSFDPHAHKNVDSGIYSTYTSGYPENALAPFISFNRENNTCWIGRMAISFALAGDYTETDDTVTADCGENNIYVFRKSGDKLILDKSQSSIKEGQFDFEDGTVFAFFDE